MHKGDPCGCFLTGFAYPGIAKELENAPPEHIGMAVDIANLHYSEIPFAIIDTETTGFSYDKGDRVVEFAAIYFQNFRVTAKHSIIINPRRLIPAVTSAVHGLTDEHVRNSPTFDQCAREIIEILRGRVPVAYKASFDKKFIHSEMRACGCVPSHDVSMPPALRTNVTWIDPLIWARAIQPGNKSYRLVEVVNRLNIRLKDAHQAAADAEATGHVLMKFLETMPDATYRDIVQKQREFTSRGFTQRGKGK